MKNDKTSYTIYTWALDGNGVKGLNAVIGRYVWSKAGRDKDRLFIILDILDDAHVLIADGELRPVNRPKKKKLKHLKISEKVSDEVSEAVQNRKRLNDSDVRKAVKRYMNELKTCIVGEEG